MIRAIELAPKLPKHSHRALLHLIDAENYLEDLEKYNFELYNKELMKPSLVIVPLRMRKASVAGRYFHNELSKYL
jgi:hypothetical protein